MPIKSFQSNWFLVLFLLFGITKQLLTDLLLDSADCDPLRKNYFPGALPREILLPRGHNLHYPPKTVNYFISNHHFTILISIHWKSSHNSPKAMRIITDSEINSFTCSHLLCSSLYVVNQKLGTSQAISLKAVLYLDAYLHHSICICRLRSMKVKI